MIVVFSESCSQGPSSRSAGAELGRQRGRRQVASDQDVIGVEREHPLDDFLDPFEPELPRPAHHERRHSQETLAEELQRIEGIPPEMDVRDVNQPERAGVERHRGSTIAGSVRARGAKSIRESRWQMADGKWQADGNCKCQRLIAMPRWFGRIRPTGGQIKSASPPSRREYRTPCACRPRCQSLG